MGNCGCSQSLAHCENVSSATILATLFLVAPQFITTDPVKLAGYQSFINLLYCQVNQCILGCNSSLAFAFLLAHYLTIASQPNGPFVGVYSDMKEGELSLGFNVAADMSALLLTPYGRSYVDLVKRTVVGSTVTNLPPALGGVNNGIPICCGGFGSGYGFWGYYS